uniref:tenascin-N-like n=1 Tax=Styela clava TaxID=7725 RepID=UPI0019392BA0|nr:tenascin-N-like [Styela clava]
MEPECTYSVKVRAESGITSSFLTIKSRPLPPQNVTVKHNERCPSNSIVVNFDSNGSKQYRVTLCDSTGILEFKEGSKNFYTFHGLKPGNAYEVYVQSRAEGEPDPIFSNQAYAPRDIVTYPDNPTNLQETNQPKKIKWNEADGATEYEVEVSCGIEQPQNYKTSDTSMVVPNLMPGQTYNVRVAGKNLAGISGYSNTIEIKTEPKAPEQVRAQPMRSSPHDALIVSFDAEDQPDQRFKVFAHPLGDINVPVPTETGTFHAVLKDLKPGETYEICVVAERNGQHSKRAICPILVQTYPGKPGGVDYEMINGRLNIKWDELAIKPTRYRVNIKVNGQTKSEQTTTDNSLTITGIAASSTYQIKVAAENEAGCGVFSDEVEVKTDPSPPTRVRVTHNMADPKRSFQIMIEDSDKADKQYQIVARPAEGDDTVMTTKQKFCILSGLQPGQNYAVFVISQMGDERVSQPVYGIPQRRNPQFE